MKKIILVEFTETSSETDAHKSEFNDSFLSTRRASDWRMIFMNFVVGIEGTLMFGEVILN